jgi:hypothetical protein
MIPCSLLEVRIPHSAVARREPTWALVVRGVRSSRGLAVFDGAWLRTGSTVQESELRPSPDYPDIPLLIEFAGSDRTGRGHARSQDIHILWRYDPRRRAWTEIIRTLSEGGEWTADIACAVRRELARPAAGGVENARRTAQKVIEVLDTELGVLDTDARTRALSFLYDQFAARLCSGEHARF